MKLPSVAVEMKIVFWVVVPDFVFELLLDERVLDLVQQAINRI